MKDMFIVMNFEVEGTHYWSACPYDDVGFLRNEHRHVFKFKCLKRVTHSDRDIEIIRFKREMKRWVETFLRDENKSFGYRSCEMIADEIMDRFDLYSIEVLEDGENGAYLIRKEV